VTARQSNAPGLALAAFLALLLASTALGQEAVIRGRCVGVHDGDSITLLSPEYTQIKIRVAFLDAPELGQPFGNNAKQAMSALVFGKDIAVYPHTIDRYGRTVAVVYVDGIDAGLELLRQGLAWVYSRYVVEASPDIQASYQQAETDAREQRRGLWSDPGPVAPWEFRRVAKGLWKCFKFYRRSVAV
jgi:endonuclease YncB( thermonuclease family)